jgi:hypothetical protein
LLHFKPQGVRLDLNGTQNTARIITALAFDQAMAARRYGWRKAHECMAQSAPAGS